MNTKEVTWGDYVYPSQRELARYLERNESTVRGWIRRGYSGAEQGAWLWQGKIYKTLKQLAETFPEQNKSLKWYSRRMKRGIHTF